MVLVEREPGEAKVTVATANKKGNASDGLKQRALDKTNGARLEGNKLFSEGKYEAALLRYRVALRVVSVPEVKAVASAPEVTELRSICHSNSGICFLKLGKYEDSIKEYTKALELNPTYIKALIRRAKTLVKLEHFEEAIADLKKILELDPSNNKARRTIPHLEPLAAEKREKLKGEMIGMTLDEDRYKEKLSQCTLKKKASEDEARKKRARKEVASGPSSKPIPVLEVGWGYSALRVEPIIDQKDSFLHHEGNVMLGVRHSDLVLYPERGEIFRPDWGLKINESVSTNLRSAVKYAQGCVPPEDDRLIAAYDNGHLNSFLAMSSAKTLFLAREQMRRFEASEEANQRNLAAIRDLEAIVLERDRKIDELKLQLTENELELAARGDKLSKSEFKLGETRHKLAKLECQLAQDAQAKAIREREWEAKFEDSETKLMEGCLCSYKMAWNDLKGKARVKYPDMDLEDITPSIDFISYSASPSQTLSGDDGASSGDVDIES